MRRPEPRGEPCAEIDQEHQSSPDRPADRGPVAPPHPGSAANHALRLTEKRRRSSVPGGSRAHPGNVS